MTKKFIYVSNSFHLQKETILKHLVGEKYQAIHAKAIKMFRINILWKVKLTFLLFNNDSRVVFEINYLLLWSCISKREKGMLYKKQSWSLWNSVTSYQIQNKCCVAIVKATINLYHLYTFLMTDCKFWKDRGRQWVKIGVAYS